MVIDFLSLCSESNASFLCGKLVHPYYIYYMHLSLNLIRNITVYNTHHVQGFPWSQFPIFQLKDLAMTIYAQKLKMKDKNKNYDIIYTKN